MNDPSKMEREGKIRERTLEGYSSRESGNQPTDEPYPVQVIIVKIICSMLKN